MCTASSAPCMLMIGCAPPPLRLNARLTCASPRQRSSGSASAPIQTSATGRLPPSSMSATSSTLLTARSASARRAVKSYSACCVAPPPTDAATPRTSNRSLASWASPQASCEVVAPISRACETPSGRRAPLTAAPRSTMLVAWLTCSGGFASSKVIGPARRSSCAAAPMNCLS